MKHCLINYTNKKNDVLDMYAFFPTGYIETIQPGDKKTTWKPTNDLILVDIILTM